MTEKEKQYPSPFSEKPFDVVYKTGKNSHEQLTQRVQAVNRHHALTKFFQVTDLESAVFLRVEIPDKESK